MIIIVSGGQTGGDRGGLDAAIAECAPHRGWCPLGRIAEDGVIPPQYRLHECDSTDYRVRNYMNVMDSFMTVAFGLRSVPTKGTSLTLEYAVKLKRPCIYVDLSNDPVGAVLDGLPKIFDEEDNLVINVVGTRESQAPGIQASVCDVMRKVIKTWRLG